MDETLAILIAMAMAAAVALGVPISLTILWSRTRTLRERIEKLEQDLHDLQDLRAREARGVPGVPDVPKVRETPAVRQPIPDAQPPVVRAASPAPEAHEARDAPRAPYPPLAPDAPRAPRAPVAPLAPRAPLAPLAPRAPEAPRAAEAGRAAEPESLESVIGSRWFLYIGVIAVVVGIAYFEKFAIDRHWLSPMARVIQGAVIGLMLMFTGTRFIRRGYDAYGQIIMGGGGAILYLSTYAAFNFYALIGQSTAYALMIAITVLIAWLADRERSQGLALFAVGGGFATPFMLPGPTDAQIALFTYDAILIAGTAALSHRRDWPVLNLVSYGFTLLTVASWAERFYTPDKYLRTELYLTLYCASFLYILRECRQKESGAARLAVFILWTAPAAYYLASLAILAPHDVALLVWLVAVMLAGGIVASRVGPAAGFAVWIAVALPLAIWCDTPAASGMRQEGLIAVAAVYVIALLTQLEGTVFRDEPRAPSAADVFWIHLNPLGMYAGAYLLISPVSLVNAGYLAAALAAWQGVLAGVIWRRRGELAIHFGAVGFTLAAIAIALIFSGTAITTGWAVEGAVVIALGLRQRLTWLRGAGLTLFAIAVFQTIALLSAPPPVSHVVFLNPRAACAALVIALCYLLAWLDWRDADVPHRETAMAVSLLTAQFVTLALLTSEINAFWAIRNGYLERQLMLSVTWGLYGTAIILIGLARDYAPLRYFAMLVLALTITKVFFVDMAELDRVYRIGSVILLGILLLVTSYFYTRARRIPHP